MSAVPIATQQFTGPASAVGPAFDPESDDVQLTYISFPAGVMNKWHVHTTSQVLVVTEGRVVVETRDELVEVVAGDVVVCPSGIEHRHGAAPGSTATHLSILPKGSVLTWTAE